MKHTRTKIIELIPVDEKRQPKNSWRFEYAGGDTGIETLYVKKSSMEKLPQLLLITMEWNNE